MESRICTICECIYPVDNIQVLEISTRPEINREMLLYTKRITDYTCPRCFVKIDKMTSEYYDAIKASN